MALAMSLSSVVRIVPLALLACYGLLSSCLSFPSYDCGYGYDCVDEGHGYER